MLIGSYKSTGRVPAVEMIRGEFRISKLASSQIAFSGLTRKAKLKLRSSVANKVYKDKTNHNPSNLLNNNFNLKQTIVIKLSFILT